MQRHNAEANKNRAESEPPLESQFIMRMPPVNRLFILFMWFIIVNLWFDY